IARSDEELVKWCYRTVRGREADPSGMEHFIDALRSGVDRIDVLAQLLESDEHGRLSIAWKFVPPGHHYSPIPSEQDIDEFARRYLVPEAIEGIDLNDAGQRALLEDLAAFYPSVPFTDEPQPGFRYRYVNPAYSYADAIFLH